MVIKKSDDNREFIQVQFESTKSCDEDNKKSRGDVIGSAVGAMILGASLFGVVGAVAGGVIGAIAGNSKKNYNIEKS